MSMDAPNEYEQAIESYAAAVRAEREAALTLERARLAHGAAVIDRQTKWRTVKAFVTEGKIERGVYRLHKSPGLYCDAIVIEPHHDYPELFPMFR